MRPQLTLTPVVPLHRPTEIEIREQSTSKNNIPFLTCADQMRAAKVRDPMETQLSELEVATTEAMERCVLDNVDILFEICVRSPYDVITTMSQISRLWSRIQGFARSPHFWYRRTLHFGQVQLAFDPSRNWHKRCDLLTYLRLGCRPGSSTELDKIKARWIVVTQTEKRTQNRRRETGALVRA